jgi:hypothetical protein
LLRVSCAGAIWATIPRSGTADIPKEGSIERRLVGQVVRWGEEGCESSRTLGAAACAFLVSEVLKQESQRGVLSRENSYRRYPKSGRYRNTLGWVGAVVRRLALMAHVTRDREERASRYRCAVAVALCRGEAREQETQLTTRHHPENWYRRCPKSGRYRNTFC